MSDITLCTTFPNAAWDVYARESLTRFAALWPADIAHHVFLDDAALADACRELLKDRRSIVHVGKGDAHDAFLARNAGRDHPTDFRRQASRFSHKIASLRAALGEAQAAYSGYLIWMDSDVITRHPIDRLWLKRVLPRAPAYVSYLGRKDWFSSECGFMGFRMSAGAVSFIKALWALYDSDALFQERQWDDSFLFDIVRARLPQSAFFNISEGVPGNNVWLATKLAERLDHWKGPVAKRNKRPTPDIEEFGKVPRYPASS